jgi:hypothetical protein
LALPIFAVTLFVSAFMLFLVQPMIGKMILPALGGTPQVWNTCMVFFQAALLAGYAYTHTVSTRLPLRKQLLLHGVLLFLPIMLLLALGPFNITGFRPPPGANPIPYTLYQLTLIVGLPFFVVATSAPLLQKWFAATGHPSAKDPYFLYAASNAGSMLALLAYPFLVEPFLLLRQQAWTWTFGYSLLLLLVIVCILLVWKIPPSVKLATVGGPAAPPKDEGPASSGPTNPPATGITANPPAPSAPQATAIKRPPKHQPRAREEEPVAGAPHMTDEITPWRKARWVALGAIPVSLMLGVTTHISTDLSPNPLVWLAPLTLYLLSFILVFSRWPVVWTEKPHQFMLNLQPVALCLMIFTDIYATQQHLLGPLVVFLWLGFFWTAMVCHGELARDRPDTRHLTEFYLWMSVGGVTGGIFNALIAPILFPRIWEFPLAIMAAGLLRPTMKESGWTDDLVADFMDKPAPQPQVKKGKHQPQHVARAQRNPSFHYTMDVVLPGALLVVLLLLGFAFPDQLRALAGGNTFATYLFLFGIPLMICCFYYARPLRFGLGIGVVLFVHLLYTGQGRDTIYTARSYFGVIRVIKTANKDTYFTDSQGGTKYPRYTQLLHGTTDHGMNFVKPDEKKYWNNPKEDYSRLATTYYHVLGPAGRGMERFNWFKDGDPSKERNTINLYRSDARMPASLVGLANSIGSPLPVDPLVGLWSEPPYATIGLGTGTMASYGRPFQHVHFYEIDNLIKKLSLPPKGGEAYFTYLQQAKDRGAEVQVLMGDARLRMAQPYKNFNEFGDTTKPDVLLRDQSRDSLVAGGPENFYHLMVVDAFSSDAIPVHLITKQAIEMYFAKLVPEGILCVHTSNRHVDLVKVVADVARSITWKEGPADNLFITLPGSKIQWCRFRGDQEQRNKLQKEFDEGNITKEQLKERLESLAKEEAEKERHLVCLRGHDQAPEGRALGHYTSEWVLVARDPNVLSFLKTVEPENYKTDLRAARERGQRVNPDEPYWNEPPTFGRYIWTDDYSNIIRVLRPLW